MSDLTNVMTNSSGMSSNRDISNLTEAMVKASDSVGVDRILLLTCDPEQKRQEAKDLADRLSGCITLLIPIEARARQIAILHEPHPIGTRPSVIYQGRQEEASILQEALLEEEGIGKYHKSLNSIEKKIRPADDKELEEIIEQLHDLGETINVYIAKLRFLLRSLAYTSKFCKNLVENMVTKIGYKDYHEEAMLYVNSIDEVVATLNLDLWTQSEFPVWCDDASRNLSLMTDIATKRVIVERLVAMDRSRRSKTVILVTTYITVFVAIVVSSVLFFGGQLIIKPPLTGMTIPLMGIPWPVLVWSLIGSFAAMLHRLNKQPIYEFDSAFRWLLTRPVQGVVLGAAMYLIIKSGLFLLTNGSNPSSNSTPNELTITEIVTLLLCFLVGFSDRFADSILNAVVKRYAPSDTTPQETVSEAK